MLIKGGDYGDVKRHFIPLLISKGDEVDSGVGVVQLPRGRVLRCVFVHFQNDLIPKLNTKTPL